MHIDVREKTNMIGGLVSHFEILEELGRGGIGVVYKAHDTKLCRPVALKFLSPELTWDRESTDRFILEAQTASALDHANICTIHEINETAEGQLYIAMAYYEGQTAQKLAGKLKIAQALDIVIQAARGLQRAHEAGIVHRDIKPSNIMITKRAEVKIIDFGLAKLANRGRQTRTGATLGTAAYMSPEQLQAKPVDQRTDIWSLGVVLYEMLTGILPFRGDCEAALIYSIVNEKPKPLARHCTGVSEGLQRIISKALAKKSAARYSEIAELIEDLQAERIGASHFNKPAVRAIKSVARAPLVIFSAFLVAIAFYPLVKPAFQPVAPVHRQITFAGNAFSSSISPDGEFIAYFTGAPRGLCKLMVQDLSGGAAVNVFEGESGIGPCWSPDGTEILFYGKRGAQHGTFIVPRFGGTPRLISTAQRGFHMPSWSPDGSRIVEAREGDNDIHFINKDTGAQTTLALGDSFAWVAWPEWSPSGNQIIFESTRQGLSSIWMVALQGKRPQQLIKDDQHISSPQWSPKGEAVYFYRGGGDSRDLMRISVSSKTGRATGEPVIVMSGLQAGLHYAIARDERRMVYSRSRLCSNLWLATRDGRGEKFMTMRKLTDGTSLMTHPRFSPEGTLLAFAQEKGGTSNVCILPLAGGPMKQVTFFSHDNGFPVWSADGSKIAFGSNHTGANQVWTANVEGGPPVQFCQTQLSGKLDLAWGQGGAILYQQPDMKNYHILNPATGAERPLAADSLFWQMSHARLAPDGKNVAVNAHHQKRGGAAAVWLISVESGLCTLLYEREAFPVEWSANGEWVYVAQRGAEYTEIVKVHTRRREVRMVVKVPFESDYYNLLQYGLSMTPDGRRLVCPVLEAEADVWLVENFDPSAN